MIEVNLQKILYGAVVVFAIAYAIVFRLSSVMGKMVLIAFPILGALAYFNYLNPFLSRDMKEVIFYAAGVIAFFSFVFALQAFSSDNLMPGIIGFEGFFVIVIGAIAVTIYIMTR